MKTNSTTLRKCSYLFLLAVAVRLALFIHISPHPETILQPDSVSYVDVSTGYLQHGVLSHPAHPERPDVYRMPIYPLFLAVIMKMFAGNLLAVVLVQVLLDGVTVVLVYLLAEKVWKGCGFAAGFLTAINLGLVTYSHFILTETLFLLIFVSWLLALLAFMEKLSWSKTMLLGLLLGILTLIRPVAAYLPFIVFPFLLLFLVLKQREHVIRALAHLSVIGAIFLTTLSPWVIRNHRAYGHYRLMAQSGEHLVQYLVPFVWQYSKGLPFIEGVKRVNAEMKVAADTAGVDLQTGNPFEISSFQTELAKDYLRREPFGAIAKAWFLGTVKNLFAPAVVDLTYLLRIDRPHFFATPGVTVLERGKNFILSSGGFGVIMVLNMAIICLFRLLQLGGLVVLARRGQIWLALLCAGLISYFLLISGPVGYTKYRLPFEPILSILAAVTLNELWYEFKKRRSRDVSSKLST
jgi:4-amino-4-deoxy-L-arabinose transferase-like glycosyltransferase